MNLKQSDGFRMHCIDCEAVRPMSELICGACQGLLEIQIDLTGISLPQLKRIVEERRLSRKRIDGSGVWRYRELVAPYLKEGNLIGGYEGNTSLYWFQGISDLVGLERFELKHEGENPSGSFKDRGMAVAISAAKQAGAGMVVCASTGNTSASAAMYAAWAGLKAVVIIPGGKIAPEKLAQAIEFGATILQIEGNFDTAMDLVPKLTELYPVNSLNPHRIQGQKTIALEILDNMGFESPDWIVVPAGNLGNTSAIGKAVLEAHELGLINRVPRIASIQAEGASPFARYWANGGEGPFRPVSNPETFASAIKIGAPVSWKKAIAVLRATNGTATSVTEQELFDAQKAAARYGVSCELASAAAIAGTKKLVHAGVIEPHEHVVGVLTGHGLKGADLNVRYHEGRLEGIESTYANKPLQVEPTLDGIWRALKL